MGIHLPVCFVVHTAFSDAPEAPATAQPPPKQAKTRSGGTLFKKTTGGQKATYHLSHRHRHFRRTMFTSGESLPMPRGPAATKTQQTLPKASLSIPNLSDRSIFPEKTMLAPRSKKNDGMDGSSSSALHCRDAAGILSPARGYSLVDLLPHAGVPYLQSSTSSSILWLTPGMDQTPKLSLSQRHQAISPANHDDVTSPSYLSPPPFCIQTNDAKMPPLNDAKRRRHDVLFLTPASARSMDDGGIGSEQRNRLPLPWQESRHSSAQRSLFLPQL